MEKMMDNGYENIKLETIGDIFYNGSLKWLYDNNIKTIGQLMKADYIFSGFIIDDPRIHNNIETAYKLLRCKYLGVDPQMEIVDNYEIEDIEFWLNFKDSTKIALGRNGITAEELKNIIRSNDEISAYNVLLARKKIGPVCAKEIVYKMSIVLDYYSKKETIVNNLESGVIENNEVTSKYYYKMLEIGKKIDALKSEFDSVLDEMLEQMVSQGTVEAGKPYEKHK